MTDRATNDGPIIMRDDAPTRLIASEPDPEKSQRPASRFMSEKECLALARRAANMAVGGGDTSTQLESTWTGNIRFARNAITTSGDVRDNDVMLKRDIHGAFALIQSNQIDDVGMEATIRRAERVLRMREEGAGSQFSEHYVMPPKEVKTYDDVLSYELRQAAAAAERSLTQTAEPYLKPKIFFDTTYGLDAAARAAAIEPLVAPTRAAGMLAAGYVQVSAHGRAVMDTWGRALYYPYTQAQYSVTVRDPKGSGSGWAGVDYADWTRIDTAKISATALDKCQRSRNPVAVEPGRYTVILEPQAVCDLFSYVMTELDRGIAEDGHGPFAGEDKTSKIGQRVFDERITVSADPMDPDLGFPPFDRLGNVYHPVTWIEQGVLKDLSYYRPYAIRNLGKNSGLPNSGACRMSGGTTSIEEMIATTKRGLVVTRFSNMAVVDPNSLLMTGYTRDGLWLIENGKITKPVKNFRFTESPMFVFNNVEQLGVPTRAFHPGAPFVVPPVKARDFSFTSLIEAI